MDSGKKVMIVEDSPTIRHFVKLLLENLGVQLVEVGSEWGMMTKIDEYGKLVDLILMDITLKYENGFDLIKKLKENPKYREIPVVVLTEHADREHVLRAKDLGVVGYLRKPLDKEDFLARVAKILGIPLQTALAEQKVEED